MKRRESDSFLMLFLKLRGGINVYPQIRNYAPNMIQKRK